MKLIEKTPEFYKFETANGTTFTRERLKWTHRSVEIKGWKDSRNLMVPTESDLEFFPGVEYRIETTTRRGQDDPLYTTIPCRIKKGTKTILEIFSADGSISQEVRISKMFKW